MALAALLLVVCGAGMQARAEPAANEKPGDAPVEKPAQAPADAPVAAPADAPVDAQSDTPHEAPRGVPSEAAGETPGAASDAVSGEVPSVRPDPRDSLCLMIEAAATAHGLPVEFFARVIWQESRFNARAVGPVTRNGQRAQGIAQFMPGTAAERQLLDPFDPVQALPKSAEFLRELRTEFGNLGLAAAAYNAGPQRLRNFLAGSGYMPTETRRYVFAITGNSVEEWVALRDRNVDKTMHPGWPGCAALMATLRQAPNPFVDALARRVETAAMRPWGVQLSAGFSRARALASYGRLADRFGTLLDNKDPIILAGALRSRGTRAFYQVRIGADSRADADTLCKQLRRAGGACLVLRNQAGRLEKSAPG